MCFFSILTVLYNILTSSEVNKIRDIKLTYFGCLQIIKKKSRVFLIFKYLFQVKMEYFGTFDFTENAKKQH